MSVILFYDNTINTADSAIAEQEDIRERQSAYEVFFNDIKALLKEGDMVYQLPFQQYPEAGAVGNMMDYTHFLAYFMADNLRWSYGGEKGRNTRAEELNIDGGKSKAFIESLIDEGIKGVYIDTSGYQDSGTEILEFYRSLNLKELHCDKLKFFLLAEIE